mgnify:CR=1 FL=1
MNIKLIIGVAVIVFVLLVFCVSYVKAPPNKAYIISGLKKTKDTYRPSRTQNTVF